jgi:hypothetical protein
MLGLLLAKVDQTFSKIKRSPYRHHRESPLGSSLMRVFRPFLGHILYTFVLLKDKFWLRLRIQIDACQGMNAIGTSSAKSAPCVSSQFSRLAWCRRVRPSRSHQQELKPKNTEKYFLPNHFWRVRVAGHLSSTHLNATQKGPPIVVPIPPAAFPSSAARVCSRWRSSVR